MILRPKTVRLAGISYRAWENEPVGGASTFDYSETILANLLRLHPGAEVGWRFRTHETGARQIEVVVDGSPRYALADEPLPPNATEAAKTAQEVVLLSRMAMAMANTTEPAVDPYFHGDVK